MPRPPYAYLWRRRRPAPRPAPRCAHRCPTGVPAPAAPADPQPGDARRVGLPRAGQCGAHLLCHSRLEEGDALHAKHRSGHCLHERRVRRTGQRLPPPSGPSVTSSRSVIRMSMPFRASPKAVSAATRTRWRTSSASSCNCAEAGAWISRRTPMSGASCSGRRSMVILQDPARTPSTLCRRSCPRHAAAGLLRHTLRIRAHPELYGRPFSTSERHTGTFSTGRKLHRGSVLCPEAEGSMTHPRFQSCL